MYDRDGGGGRSATPTGFAFVWITCLCHVWSVTGYWSSGLGGGGRAGPNAAGCGALEVEIIWERMQLWRLGGALRAAALHSVSPEAQGRLIFGGTERWSMQDRMPRHRRAMPLTEAANVCERVHLHPTPLTFI